MKIAYRNAAEPVPPPAPVHEFTLKLNASELRMLYVMTAVSGGQWDGETTRNLYKMTGDALDSIGERPTYGCERYFAEGFSQLRFKPNAHLL